MPQLLTLQQMMDGLGNLDEDELTELRDAIDEELGDDLESLDALEEDEDDEEDEVDPL